MKLKLLKKYKNKKAGDLIEVSKEIGICLIKDGTAKFLSIKDIVRDVLVKPQHTILKTNKRK